MTGAKFKLKCIPFLYNQHMTTLDGRDTQYEEKKSDLSTTKSDQGIVIPP